MIVISHRYLTVKPKINVFIYLTLLSAVAYVQPTLTAATNNPHTGETFTVFGCNITGVKQGARGPSVTRHIYQCLAPAYQSSYL